MPKNKRPGAGGPERIHVRRIRDRASRRCAADHSRVARDLGAHRRTDSSAPCADPRQTDRRDSSPGRSRRESPRSCVQFSRLMSTQMTESGQLRRFGMTTPVPLPARGGAASAHALLAGEHQTAPAPAARDDPALAQEPRARDLAARRKARIAVQRAPARQQERQRAQAHERQTRERRGPQPRPHIGADRRSSSRSARSSAGRPRADPGAATQGVATRPGTARRAVASTPTPAYLSHTGPPVRL